MPSYNYMILYLSSFLRSPDNSVVNKSHEEVYQVSLGEQQAISTAVSIYCTDLYRT